MEAAQQRDGRKRYPVRWKIISLRLQYSHGSDNSGKLVSAEVLPRHPPARWQLGPDELIDRIEVASMG